MEISSKNPVSQYFSPAIPAARNAAENLGWTEFNLELLLLGLLQEPSGESARLLAAAGLDQQKVLSHLADECNFAACYDQPTPTLSAQICMELASYYAQNTGFSKVHDLHLLMGILCIDYEYRSNGRDWQSEGIKLLERAGINLRALWRNVVSELAASPNFQPRSPFFSESALFNNTPFPYKGASEPKQGPNMRPYSNPVRTPSIDRYTNDLVAAAMDGSLPICVGRKSEITQLCTVLSLCFGNSPMLVGERGVGKTSIVRGLAQQIADGTAPELLLDKRIVELNATAIVGGTGKRGDLEGRLDDLFAEIKKVGNLILFIDNTDTLAGAAAGAENTTDITTPLVAALKKNELQCIGACAPDRFRRNIETRELGGVFQKIDVAEPALADTETILAGLLPQLQTHHSVIIPDAALTTAIQTTNRYLPYQAQPKKALNALDLACATLATTTTNKTLTPEMVVAAVGKMANLPLQELNEMDLARLANMETVLAQRVVGQTAHISTLARTVKRNKLGLGDPTKPIGAFFFVGPTGVGKTELARALAEFLFGNEAALLRFDMSEYQEKHSVARLIGAPPGYIGYSEGGKLTNAVRKQPFSVLLFDEIEKAHPDVCNLFLQIMEEGELTDGEGKPANFRNTVVIFTSNSGSAIVREQEALGFCKTNSRTSSQEKAEKSVKQAVNSSFSPEFRNRLTAVCQFQPLTREALTTIVSLLLDRVNRHLKTTTGLIRDTQVRLHKSALELLLSEGFDEQLGARPMKRAIDQFILDRLTLAFLTGSVQSGDSLEAFVEDGIVNFRKI